MTGNLKRIALMGTVAAMPLLLALPSGAQAQTAPGGGAFPGSLLIPGTNSSLKIGGYVKLDASEDFQENPGDFAFFNSIPINNVGNNLTTSGAGVQKGTFHLGARQSRLNVETRTPTAFGTLKTYIEGDFFGTNNGGNSVVTNSANFDLRHAYAELGPFLAGHTWSLTMDLEAYPETLDFNGAIGQIFIRQSSVRYTYNLGAWTIAGAIEEPEADFRSGTNSAATAVAGGATLGNSIPDQQTGLNPANNPLTLDGVATQQSSPNVGNYLPDFVGRIQTHQSWGEASLYGVLREVGEHNVAFSRTLNIGNTLKTLNFAPNDTTAFGYLIGGTATIKTFGKDNLKLQANWADGGNRYIFYLFNQSAGLSVTGTGTAGDPFRFGQLQTIQGWGAYAYYQHWWTDTIRSTGGFGALRSYNNTALLAGNPNIDRLGFGSNVNLVWSPVPNTNVGFEYVYQRREIEGASLTDTQSHGHGQVQRLTFSSQVLF